MRRVKLTDHFINQWHERVGNHTPFKIRSMVWAQVRYGTLTRSKYGRFEVPLGKFRIIIVPDICGGWVAITILRCKGDCDDRMSFFEREGMCATQ